MFTGIIEEIGDVEQIQKGRHSAKLFIHGEKVLEGTRVGDSIAVNGVCLTVTNLFSHKFSADVMHETLNRSALSNLAPGSRVNLERAMAANGRFGGHIVAGHVDGVGKILAIQRDDTAVWYTIEVKTELMRYIVEKGSVAIDGISLTVATAADTYFSISAIPHTVSQTVLRERRVGDQVNVETDVIGKYVEKLLSPLTPGREPKKEREHRGITREFLSQNGF